MKKPHRRAHFLMWLIIAPIVAITFAIALTSRPGVPFNETTPETLADVNAAGGD
ncbi:MAG: hypothetical protein AAGC77_05415 [Pseudomonadota bacterium]